MKKKIVTLMMASAIVFAACKKEPVNPNQPTASETTQAMAQRLGATPIERTQYDASGFLIFSSMDDFNQIMIKNANGENTVGQLETKFPSFRGMKHIYVECSKAESAALDLLESNPPHYTSPLQYAYLTTTAQENQNMFLFEECADSPGQYKYSMNINDKQLEYADYSTVDGIVKIGNYIYRFSKNYVKVITDGNKAKIPLFEETTVSNPSNNIYVYPAAEFTLGSTEYNRVAVDGCKNAFMKYKIVQSGKAKMSICGYFDQYPNSVNSTFQESKFTFKVTSMQWRRVGFIWVDDSASELNVSGAFSGIRSPYGASGNSGYNYNNPYYFSYSSAITHFTDVSQAYLPCFTMDHATYRADATLRGVPLSADIWW